MTWATSVPILVFLGLSCSRVRPDVRDRQTVRQKHRLMPPPYGGGGMIMGTIIMMIMGTADMWMRLGTTDFTVSPYRRKLFHSQ